MTFAYILSYHTGSALVKHESCKNLLVLKGFPNDIHGGFRRNSKSMVFVRFSLSPVYRFEKYFVLIAYFSGTPALWKCPCAGLILWSPGDWEGSRELTLKEQLLIRQWITSSYWRSEGLENYKPPLINKVFFAALLVRFISEFLGSFLLHMPVKARNVPCIISLSTNM